MKCTCFEPEKCMWLEWRGRQWRRRRRRADTDCVRPGGAPGPGPGRAALGGGGAQQIRHRLGGPATRAHSCSHTPIYILIIVSGVSTLRYRPSPHQSPAFPVKTLLVPYSAKSNKAFIWKLTIFLYASYFLRVLSDLFCFVTLNYSDIILFV